MFFFSGSGGAIVGLLPDPSRFEELRKAYEGEGFVVTRVRPNIPGGEDSKNTVDEEESAMANSSSNTSDVKESDSSSSNSAAVKEASSSSNSSPVKGSDSNSNNSSSNGTIPEGERLR